jgi:hypothetical protein
MIQQMQCCEQRRLLTLYAEATNKLSAMTSALANAAVSYERDAFDRAWEKCEAARRLCGDIRCLMYEHIDEHRCGLQLPSRRSKE